MTLKQALKHIQAIYHKAEHNPSIRKPISYSVYQTWKWCDAYEKERGKDEDDTKRSS